MNTAPASRAPSLVFLLSVAGIALTVLLVREHLTAYSGDAVSGPFCGGGGHFDCGRVAAHPSSWFLGIPTAAWGMMMYVVIAGLSLMAMAVRGGERAAALTLGAWVITAGIAVNAFLAYVMLVHINTVCLMCVWTYAINVTIALFLWFAVRGAGRPEWKGLFTRWTPERSPAATAGEVAPAAPQGLQIDAKLLVGAFTVAGLLVASVVTGRSVLEANSMADFEVSEFSRTSKADSTRVDMSMFEGQPSRGPVDAKVQIAVIGDYQCQWCRGLENNLERLREEFPDQIRVVFVHAPLSAKCNTYIEASESDPHSQSCEMTTLGECATAQGKFWEFHDFMYDRVPMRHVNPGNAERLFDKMGLDPERMKACIASQDPKPAIDRDVEIFHRLGLSSVPGMAINGRLRIGGISPRALRTIVLAAMKQNGAPTTSAR